MTSPVYYGNSMRSVFTAGERLQLENIDFEQLQIGDVVAVFSAGKQYVHRVIQIADGRAVTMGDNNFQPDKLVLTAGSDFKLVTAAADETGAVRPIAGGAAGMKLFKQHQKLQRRRRWAADWFKRLEKLFFWRITLREKTSFGDETCYYYRNQAIARRTGSGAVVYNSWRNRLRFRVPEDGGNGQ